MTDYQKCTHQEGGYAATFCEGMERTVDIKRSKASKGVFLHTMMNIETRESLGDRVVIYSATRPNGIVLNYCPFCGGSLRDGSND